MDNALNACKCMDCLGSKQAVCIGNEPYHFERSGHTCYLLTLSMDAALHKPVPDVASLPGRAARMGTTLHGRSAAGAPDQ
jgi:hypothetical protein